jgi:hypothetical protein
MLEMATLAATPQKTGTAAAIAIIAAIGGIIAVFAGHPVGGFVVELLAIVCGGLGLLMAASPRVSGGIVSIIAIVLGVFGIGMAVLGMIGRAVF